ncbi:hypothetical protein CLV51_1011724 [Chitinophaga niastensis]|uniref:Uncharacterized protein n=1 Tax=Chitinophaga niastensis TaxID=536980 RepID=A0A2P8HVX9_CHINA|nr:hypothetical protein [Chitinophaga niastensis]PSL50379.1 hypothetical protein CLV51_1011724 [Chitinophaga niastensis]
MVEKDKLTQLITENHFSAFEEAMKKILSVPKSEVDKAIEKAKQDRKAKKSNKQ